MSCLISDLEQLMMIAIITKIIANYIIKSRSDYFVLSPGTKDQDKVELNTGYLPT
jgi:hypothetical protein